MAGRRPLYADAGDEGWSPRKRENDAELDITPMIDVTFLLLIFFMVSSTMQSNRDLDVPVAKFGSGVDTQSATVITLRGDSTTEPVIILGEGTTPEGKLDDIRSYVEEGIQKNQPHVIIKAERELPTGFVQEVMRAVAEVEGAQFFIGVQDKRR